MDSLAAMKRVPVPPDEGGEPVAGPVAGRGRRTTPAAPRSPMLYLVNLRKALATRRIGAKG
jgi:hypothetical protein